MNDPIRSYGVAEAEALWATHYGRAASASRIASELDAVFRIAEGGRDYLLRVVDNRAGVADLQTAVLRHLAMVAPHLPVPRVRESACGQAVVALVAPGDDYHAAFATSFLPGRAMASASRPVDRAALLQTLAALDGALASLAHPRAARSLLWDVANADRVKPLVAAIGDPVLRQLAREAFEDWSDRAAPTLPTLRRQVIHNDFNPSNVLVSDDGAITGIIDFGDVIEAPLVCDLATALAYQDPEYSFKKLIADGLHAYGGTCPLDEAETTVLPILVRARAAMVLTILNVRAVRQPENRDYLLRNTPFAARLLASAARTSRRAG